MVKAQDIIAAEIRALMGRGLGDGKRITQTKLGEVIDVGQSGVSDRLKGKVPFDSVEIYKLAEFFDVSVASIIEPVDEARRRERVLQGDLPTRWYDDARAPDPNQPSLFGDALAA